MELFTRTFITPISEVPLVSVNMKQPPQEKLAEIVPEGVKGPCHTASGCHPEVFWAWSWAARYTTLFPPNPGLKVICTISSNVELAVGTAKRLTAHWLFWI